MSRTNLFIIELGLGLFPLPLRLFPCIAKKIIKKGVRTGFDRDLLYEVFRSSWLQDGAISIAFRALTLGSLFWLAF